MSKTTASHALSGWLLLLSVFFFGIAHIAILPPWEGFDETAHYSYINQLADTNRMTLPDETAWIDEFIAAYALVGPTPYASTAPFDENGGLTYPEFFDSEIENRKNLEQLLFAATPPVFEPSTKVNWQRQHPPLYYTLMALVARAGSDLNLAERLLLWRSVSYSFAFVGLCLAYYANRRAISTLFPGKVIPLPTLAGWPLLLPMWFSDTARIGNDSLAVLVMGLVWFLLLPPAHWARSPFTSAALGAILGVGSWVKGFFLPISVGVSIFFVTRWWTSRTSRAPNIRILAAFAGPLLAIAAPIYLLNYLRTGTLLATYDPLLFDSTKEIHSLDGKFVFIYLKSLASTAKSFIWSGTWSFGRPSLVFFIPTGALIALVISAYAASTIRQRALIAALPLFIVIPMAAGLAYHSLSFLLLSGQTSITPAWYLFILAGPIGLIAGLGVSRLQDYRASRVTVLVLTIGGATFTVLTALFQILMYTGCAVKQGANKALLIKECGSDPVLLFDRLGVIGFPSLAIMASAIGVALVLIGTFLALRSSIKIPILSRKMLDEAGYQKA